MNRETVRVVLEDYAFISYQRKDEKWVTWSQRKFESYKLPTANVKGSSRTQSEYMRSVRQD